jgi:putative acetyltransferase
MSNRSKDPPSGGTAPRDPHACRIETRYGDEVILRVIRPEDECRLCAMYDVFEPKQVTQGVPAVKRETRHAWVEGLMREPLNVIAELAATGTLVGHTCLLVMEPGVQLELLIMVHQDWQNRGIGSALMELSLGLARRSGYRRVWLSVSMRNSRALHVYEKCGFTVCTMEDLEVEMERLL